VNAGAKDTFLLYTCTLSRTRTNTHMPSNFNYEETEKCKNATAAGDDPSAATPSFHPLNCSDCHSAAAGVGPAATEATTVTNCLICLQPACVPVHLTCACQITCCAGCLLHWLAAERDNKSTADSSLRSCPTCRRTDVRVVDEQNNDLSETLYQRGRQNIIRSQHSGFTNKDLLKDSVNLFGQSIAADPQNPKAYMGMAYLAYLVSQESVSVRYCNYILDHFPESSSAEIANEILSKCSPSVTHPISNDSEPDAAVDESIADVITAKLQSRRDPF
jgi:hypothetical protein